MPNIFIITPSPLPDYPAPSPSILAFHRSLPHYAPTPLVPLPALATELGIAHLLLKDESSRLGLPAFKILGASWAAAKSIAMRVGLSSDGDAMKLEILAEKAQEAGFVLYAATEGNHGRAVARMAAYLGVKARIYVPSMSDSDVKANIASEGAEVVEWDGSYDEAVVATKAAAESLAGGKGVLVSDTALEVGDETAGWIVDGYSTLFGEIEEQNGELELEITHVLCPVGVGSLGQAVVTHFRRNGRVKKAEVVTVEPTDAACLKASLEAGRMTSVDVGYSICSGMSCGTPSASAWPILRDGVSMALAVEDVDVEKALLELREYGVNAGPCGAATTAAVRQLPGLQNDSVVLLLCTEGARRYDMEINE